MASSTPLDQWKALANYHEIQLSIAKKNIHELENPPLTQDQMKERILAMERGLAYKLDWKIALQKGLLENMQNILNEDTYRAYLSIDVGEDATEEEKKEAEERSQKFKAYLGPFGGLTWQLFVLQIIKNLHDSGGFWHCGTFDTFEDTPGGHDEVAWNVGMKILEEEAR
jgi:hypothetical protein